MRISIVFIAFLLCTLNSFSQLLRIEEIDNSYFPTMRAKFYVSKSDATSYTSIAKEQFVVMENGIVRTVDSVVCNVPNVLPVSLTLSLDDSGSMDAGDQLSDVPRVLQKAFGMTLAKAIDAPPSEIALQFGDTFSYLKINFTKNRDSIAQGISKMTLGGGNNFTDHLLNPQTGAIAIAKRGRYKRYIVFVTDGQGEKLKTADSIRCIDSLKKNSINLIVILLSASIATPNAITQSLIGITAATNGEIITNVFNENDAYKLAAKIQEKMQGGKPCEITWQSDSSCVTNREMLISVPSIPITGNGIYEAPESSVRSLEFQKDSIAFGKLDYGEKKDEVFTIMAPNYPVTVSKILSSDPRFSVVDFGGTPPPFEMPTGSSRVLVIRFTPADSGFSHSEITIVHNGCNTRLTIPVAGGHISVRPYTKTLQVAYPNGGETFGFGETIDIKWEGALPQDTMRLEYSNDHSATWKFITDTATNLHYPWRIPPVAGTSLSIRVTQIRPNSYTPEVVVMPKCLAYSWSKDGKRLLTMTTDPDSAAKIYYAATGQVQYSIYTKGLALTNICWHPDSGYVATEFDKKTTIFWNDTTRKKMITWKYGFDRVERNGKAVFIRDGHVLDFYSRYIYTYPQGGVNSKLNPVKNIIFNINTIINQKNGLKYDTMQVFEKDPSFFYGNFLGQNGGHNGHFNDAAWSNSGILIASCGNDSIPIVWKTSMDVFSRCIGHTGIVNCLKWNPKDQLLATGSNDHTIKIWYSANGSLKRNIDYDGIPKSIIFNKDGDTLVAIGTDTAAHLWDIESGQLIRNFIGSKNSITSVEYSPDDRQIITKSSDPTIRIWDIDSAAMPSAISDTTWTIVAPLLASRDIDYGKQFVNKSKDSLMVTLIKNTSIRPYMIDSMRVSGENSKDFRILDQDTSLLLLSEATKDINLRFRPTGSGKRTATLNVFVSGVVFPISLVGEGITNLLEFTADTIGFGTHLVGEQKDTLMALVQNISNTTVTISSIDLPVGNTDFQLISGGGITSIAPNEIHKITLRYSPKLTGKAVGKMICYYNLIGSPATFILTGEGKTTIGVKEAIPGKELISMYPNPADMWIQLCCFNSDNQPEVSVKDMLGNEMTHLNLTLNVDNALLLETRTLPSGLYFVQFKDGSFSGSLPFVVKH
ncbi:MAG: choice-of-anchor D domain-containing protein [Ignavibacteriae bacterium]|nr:choice-of-anchor D domain-containing protein [Ignavibacteriota bacterium]